MDTKAVIINAIDELMIRINLAICHINDGSLVSQLQIIQKQLAEIHDEFTGRKINNQYNESGIVTQLEKWIDDMDFKLPRLTGFILPGGMSVQGAELHLCRTACRSAERIMIGHCKNNKSLQFINRLSDYFFNAARIANEHTPKKRSIFQLDIENCHMFIGIAIIYGLGMITMAIGSSKFI
jgi:cob(I)alamin adenosyltransferase